MPSRRRPRDGLGMNRIFVLATAALLVIPCLVDAQQQQPRSGVPQRQESYHEGHEARRIEVTKVPQSLETPINPRRRKDTLSVLNEQQQLDSNIDASAIATFAPGKSTVEPPLSQQIARKIEDWEVEDFVLLATIDGKLHARDRRTGKERWNLVHEKPMVETKYHRRDRSPVEENYERSLFDDYLWIVEPTRDGSIYYYNPDSAQLVNTGLTMKKIHDKSPFISQDPDVSYTGTRETSMVTIDAITGDIVKFFGVGGNMINPGDCARTSGFFDQGKCSPNATLTIGRTEYTVAIQDGKTSDQIATLKFSEWTPNNFDQDLSDQYRSTLDQKYIYVSHDGSIVGLDHAKSALNPQPLFSAKFSSPVVRVFDVARPWGTEKLDPELIVLPQPMPPNQDDGGWDTNPLSSIFLNHTEDGSWYAMSGKQYPYAVQRPRLAPITQQGWLSANPAWDVTNEIDLHDALVGLHSIDHRRKERLRAIDAPQSEDKQSNDTPENVALDVPEPTTIAQTLLDIPERTVTTIWEFVTNPMWIVVIGIWLIASRSKILAWVRSQDILSKKHNKKVTDPVVQPTIEVSPKEPNHTPIIDSSLTQTATVTEEASLLKPSTEPPLAPTLLEEVTPPASIIDEEESHGEAKAAPKELTPPPESSIELEKPVPSPEKKKAHRGRRGGVKHKKGPKPKGQSTDEEPKPAPTVDDAVRNAQNLGVQTKLEPDIKTIPSDPTEVSGPILRIGQLEVNTEKLIGTGSNGTLVFEGVFDGRAVAVKRMLIQFFDIASHETKLLRESDDHENVIRYYAQQTAAEFLYIALELCPASLADVIEKPEKHRELAQKGERDLPQVLYQITNGLRYLHELRIVHRDLKPQNILVTTHRDGRPRLLVSDFGLCKKLEGEQSSFRATTAHAAGTSGWRAPELLLDDDARDGMVSMVDASTEGHSGPLVSGELPPNRRATRAIDIFSLGLVFFYVLTKGSHPYDCGDRYMREVNIRKGVFKLDQLDVLGDYAFEAKDLVRSMLDANPRARPQAHHVLSHPFFWSPKKRLAFLCDVSDHFEKEKRDPPSEALQELESHSAVCNGDFLKPLGREFVDSLGKQRKYTGTRLLDLLRALRNKRNHYEDMSDHLKEVVGPLPEGYLSFWTRRFPTLLIECWNVVYDLQWDNADRFREYYEVPGAAGI